jgi:hypothetical protein
MRLQIAAYIAATTLVSGSSLTETTTTEAPVLTKKYTIPMGPRFVFGVLQKRHKRFAATEALVACPSDKNYCIDERYSDAVTCMYPDPTTVKVCLDESCEKLPENEEIFKQVFEDSYCKDYMSPEGRVCQWTATPCTCQKYDLEYVDAFVVSPGSGIPRGWKTAPKCEYPDNFKAENKRADQDGPGRRPNPRLNMGAAQGDGGKGFETSVGISLLAALVASLSM